MGGDQAATEEEAEIYVRFILSPFSEEEAQAKVGRRVKTLEAWPRCPKGTLGTVLAVTRLRQRLTEKTVPAVFIRWDDCYCYSGRPLTMEFNKVDYEEFLVEVDH